MPQAREVAAELRKLVEGLEREPEAEVEQPLVTFYCHSKKTTFVNIARLLPHPLKKEYEGSEIVLEVGNRFKSAIWLRAKAQREAVCRIVKPAQPAVYECEPLLSEAEEAQIGGAA